MCTPSGKELTICLFLNCTLFAFQHSILWNGPVSPSVTLFEGRERRPTPLIMADLLTLVSSVGMAIALDCVGRGLGLAFAVGFATLGLALFAGSHSMETLSAGQVFYGVGFTGLRLSIDVLVTDTTRLTVRTLVYAMVSFPWAITAFSVPVLRESLQEAELRHALIAFSCLVPALGFTLTAFILHHHRCFDVRQDFSGLKSQLLGTRDRRRSNLKAFLPPALSLLAMFVALWLVQVDVVPWWTFIPFVVVFFSSLIRASSPHLIPWFVWASYKLWYTVSTYLNILFATSMGMRRMSRRLVGRRTLFSPSRSTITPLDGLRNNTMRSVCALCMIWRCTYNQAAENSNSFQLLTRAGAPTSTRTFRSRF